MKRYCAWAAYALSAAGLAACFYCQHQAAAYWDGKTAQGTDWAAAEAWLSWGTAALLTGWTSGVAGSVLWPFQDWWERAVWAVTYFCAYGLLWVGVGLL